MTRRIYIGIPYCDRVEPDVLAAAITYRSQAFESVTKCCRSSLLCRGFNELLCEALTDEEGFELFCLLHADVVPRLRLQEDGRWLDVLLHVLDTGYDAIHALVPIKSHEGFCSTALGAKSVDQQWEATRKLHLRELPSLPEVFDIDGCMEALPLGRNRPDGDLALLMNTGCMLVRLDPLRERQFPGFECKDRICWDGGKPTAQTVPEDWNFGRWCANEGLRVGATTLVATTHVGPYGYRSDLFYREEMKRRA